MRLAAQPWLFGLEIADEFKLLLLLLAELPELPELPDELLPLASLLPPSPGADNLLTEKGQKNYQTVRKLSALFTI